MPIPLQVLIIAIALSADAMAVSLSAGTTLTPQFILKKALLMALFFGAFQAIMPVIGWTAGIKILDLVKNWDHWVAGALLAGVGIKMIHESFSKDDDETSPKKDFFAWSTLFVLAIATSIDALAVGLSFSAIGLHGGAEVFCAALGIGAVTFSLSLASVFAGFKGAAFFGNKMELAGGFILIAMALHVVF